MAREVEHAGGTLARRPRVAELRAVARGAVPALAARTPVLTRALQARRRLRLAAGEDRTWDGIHVNDFSTCKKRLSIFPSTAGIVTYQTLFPGWK